MRVTSVFIEALEPGSVPGFSVRIHATGSGFEYRAPPLRARVGTQPVANIILAPNGNGFTGLLAEPPSPADRLFVHYLDEPEIDPMKDEGAGPVLT